MNLPTRHMLMGMFLGAVCAMALATTGPGIVLPAIGADDIPAPAFDPSKLVKFEDRTYLVDHEDWVATDPVSTTRVKKIEAGRVSYVTITTTESGTYSTDAMFSPHVQYPGISVERVSDRHPLRFWWAGGWYGFHARAARSFFYFRAGDTRIMSRGDVVCVSGKNYAVC